MKLLKFLAFSALKYRNFSSAYFLGQFLIDFSLKFAAFYQFLRLQSHYQLLTSKHFNQRKADFNDLELFSRILQLNIQKFAEKSRNQENLKMPSTL